MRAAIIGCGAIAPLHAEAILKSRATLTAVCDINVLRANAFAAKYGVSAYTDFEKVLDKVDAVHICTPHYLHLPMAKYALLSGRDVVLEKPPAMTLSEFEDLKSRADAAKSRITVCFQNRFNATTDLAFEIIRDKRYGELVGAKGIVTWNREGGYYTHSDWRGKLKTEGGGVLINQSIHTLDLLNCFLGNPTSVSALVSNMTHGDELEVEDTVCAQIGYGDRRATFFSTTSAAASPAAEITLFFEKATVTLDSSRLVAKPKVGDIFVFDKKQDTLHGKACWGDSHTRLIKQFYDGVTPCPLYSCTYTMKLMNAIYGFGLSKPERITL